MDIKCAFQDCDTKATYHVLFDGEGKNAVSCADHARQGFFHLFLDIHRLGSDCTMPGTVWIKKLDGTEGHCIFPLDDMDEIDTFEDLSETRELVMV